MTGWRISTTPQVPMFSHAYTLDLAEWHRSKSLFQNHTILRQLERTLLYQDSTATKSHKQFSTPRFNYYIIYNIVTQVHLLYTHHPFQIVYALTFLVTQHRLQGFNPYEPSKQSVYYALTGRVAYWFDNWKIFTYHKKSYNCNAEKKK